MATPNIDDINLTECYPFDTGVIYNRMFYLAYYLGNLFKSDEILFIRCRESTINNKPLPSTVHVSDQHLQVVFGDSSIVTLYRTMSI